MNESTQGTNGPVQPTADERRFLLALAQGVSFTDAARILGEDAIAITFSCISKGWVDSGVVTEAGRKAVHADAFPGTTAASTLEAMLESQLVGLDPLGRAKKLEAIGLALAERYGKEGKRANQLAWLERAKEARNEADRLARRQGDVAVIHDPTCSGANPCPACLDVVNRKVLPQAMKRPTEDRIAQREDRVTITGKGVVK